MKHMNGKPQHVLGNAEDEINLFILDFLTFSARTFEDMFPLSLET